MTHKMSEQFQFKVDVDDGYHYGCSTLPSGLIVVTDHVNSLLKLINPDGTVKFTSRFKDKQYDSNR